MLCLVNPEGLGQQPIPTYFHLQLQNLNSVRIGAPLDEYGIILMMRQRFPLILL